MKTGISPVEELEIGLLEALNGVSNKRSLYAQAMQKLNKAAQIFENIGDDDIAEQITETMEK